MKSPLKKLLALTLIAVMFISCTGAVSAEGITAETHKAKWTVLVYVCGSNLESKWQCVTSDLQSLEGISACDDINFVYQTGGSQEWHYGNIGADCLTRFRLNAGIMEDIQTLPLANMGDPYTLGDFLQWGVQTYPAEKYMAVLFDHGGMISGAEHDELYNSIISVPELKYAFSQAGIRFDIIGFDTCLMACYENAANLAPYGRYLVASEEIETAPGWNKRLLYDEMIADTDADALSVAKTVCDTFLGIQEKNGYHLGATISVIDLDRMADVTAALGNMAKAMSACISDPLKFNNLSYELLSSKRYFYSFSHDLADMAKRADVLGTEATQPVIDAITDAVVYKANGGDFGYSNGLSIFFELNSSSDTMNCYANLSACPDYLAFLDAINYAWRAPAKTYEQTARVADPDYAAYKVICELSESDSVPPLHITGGVNAVSSIHYNLYSMDAKENRVYLTANIPNLQVLKDNTFSPDFDGQIATIGEIPIYLSLVEEQNTYTLYETPVIIDGQEYKLRIAWYPPEAEDTDPLAAADAEAGSEWNGATKPLSSGRFEIVGLWDNSNHSGTSIPTRNILKLSDGMEITFLQYECNKEMTPAITRVLGTVTYSAKNTTVEMKPIKNGVYGLRYVIDDCLGRETFSSLITVNIRNGKMTVVK